MGRDRHFRRSALFVPGHRERMIQKALETEADCLYLDLEDSVPSHDKDSARRLVADFIRQAEGKLVYVRVNGLETTEAIDDLEAVVQPGLDGIVLPKCETKKSIEVLDYLLTHFEHKRGISHGHVAINASIETALGVVNCAEIARGSSRVASVSCGTAEDGDLQHELDYQSSDDRVALIYILSHVVVNARAAGVANVLVGPYARHKDDAGLRSEAELARRLGFTGKAAIHPRQLPIIHDVFSDSEAQLRYYERVLDAVREGQEKGLGAVSLDGQMVDLAMARRAEAVLKRHRHDAANDKDGD